MFIVFVVFVFFFVGVVVIYLLLKNMSEEGIDIVVFGSCR